MVHFMMPFNLLCILLKVIGGKVITYAFQANSFKMWYHSTVHSISSLLFFFLHALKRLKERNTSLKTSKIHKEYKFSIPCKQNFPQEKYFAASFIDFLKLRDLN